MKRLTDFTADLLQRLFGSSIQGESDKLKAIVEIAAEGEPAAILPLSHFLTDKSPLVRQAAADAVGSLVATCQPEDLAELDAEMRCYCYWHSLRSWDRFRKQDVGKLPRPSGAEAAVLGLASFHRNGHVRERAIELLDAIEGGSELPFLLIRLNDWVDAVRQAARSAVERRLHGGDFAPFVGNIALVFRLLDQQRADHAPLVQAVVRRLVEPEHEVALLGILKSDNRSVRRIAFQAAMDLDGNHRVRLVTECMHSTDPVIRLWSVRWAASITATDNLEALLRPLEHDTFMPVRREILRARIQSFPEKAEEALNAALFDRSAAIREEARFHLRKRGRSEFAETYRHAIREGLVFEGAIAGLGDTGTAEDAELLLPILQSASTRLRATAVAAIGRLGAENYAEAIFHRLADESPRVAKEAAKALRERVAVIGQERLWELFRSEARGHVRMAVLRLLDGLASWEKLPYMIRAAADSDESIATRGMISASRLYNRVFTQPSAQQRERIEASIAETAGKLPPGFEAEIRVWVSGQTR